MIRRTRIRRIKAKAFESRGWAEKKREYTANSRSKSESPLVPLINKGETKAKTLDSCLRRSD